MLPRDDRPFHQRLLIAEDDPLIRDVYGDLIRLELPEIELILVADGHQAVAVLDRQPVDVLVTDLRMPGMDGVELVEWIAAHGVLARIVVATSSPAPESLERMSRCGDYVLLEKPIDLKVLLGTVRNELEAAGDR